MVGLMVISGFNDDLPYNIAQNGGFNGDSHGRIPPKKHIKNNKQVDSASNRFQTWRHFLSQDILVDNMQRIVSEISAKSRHAKQGWQICSEQILSNLNTMKRSDFPKDRDYKSMQDYV